jgi:hypothetical protein
MPALLLVVSLFITTGQEAIGATADEKRRFLELVLEELPKGGEFFTDKEVERAAPYTRVLLSLTDEDVRKFVAERRKIDPEEFILYPLLVLSRGLLDREDQRAYGIKHFKEIADPVIKLFWGCVLFNEKAASPEIVKYLRSALESKERSEVLARMLGPDFGDFKWRVKEHPLKKK